MLFKKTKEPAINYFLQVESLSYQLAGVLKRNGSEYEVFKKETGINFDGNGEELPTLVFKLREIDKQKEYFIFVSKYEEKGESKIKLRQDMDMPQDIQIGLFEEFVIPCCQELKETQ
jgi:hypothetical protein